MRRPKLGSIYRPTYRRRDGTLVQSNNYWIKHYVNGVPLREPVHSASYADAERELRKRNGAIVEKKESATLARRETVEWEPTVLAEPVTIGGLLDDLLAYYRLHERRSLAKSTCRIKKNVVPFFGHLRALDLTTRHITAYKLKRKGEDGANATINRELELLQRSFRLAWKADPPLVTVLPWIEMLPEDNVRTGTLEHEGYTRLRELLPLHYALLFVVGYHTGARLGELLAIQWPQVDLWRGEIRLEARTTKTKKARVLPIYGDMKHWFALARRERDETYSQCPWVFQVEGKLMAFNWRTWANYCKQAGVPGLHFHDLRRTALTNMVRAGIAEKVAMEISGHRTRKTFERYHIVDDRNVREVANRMEKYLENEATGKVTGKVGPVVSAKLVN